jgi:hypothetical protein
MVNNTPMTGQQAEQLFNEICNMAVCQWKIQGEALRSMPPIMKSNLILRKGAQTLIDAFSLRFTRNLTP